MSCGLISYDGSAVPLQSIECNAEVTGEFGLYALEQNYFNECDEPLGVRYVFPIPAGGAVIGFSALIGGKRVDSEITEKQYAKRFIKENQNSAMLTKHKSGVFEAYIGMLPPKSKAVIRVKFICRCAMEDNTVRIVIPTVIAPRYVSYGQQLAFESVVGDKAYGVSLDMVYHGKDIDDIISPSHNINVEVDSYGARVSLIQPSVTDRDIVIDIILQGKNRPVMYYCGDIAYYSFTPKIDVYRRTDREYLFILDTSSSMAGEKLKQAKTALMICLRCLQAGDTFNIIAFQTMYQALSEAPVAFKDDSLRDARQWLGSINADGGTELLRPVIRACERKKSTVLLFTDGQVANDDDILTYIQSHNGAVFYTFGIDSAVNAELLTRISNISGGTAKFINVSQRIDEEIIMAFNRIAVSAVENAVITFDAPALNISPKVIKRIHAGQRVTVAAQFAGAPPNQLTVTGQFTGLKCIMQVQFEHPSKAGDELFYFYAKSQLDALKKQLTGEENRDSLIKKQIADLSVKYGVLTEETAFVLSYGGKEHQKVVDVIIPQTLPAYWEKTSGVMREGTGRKNKTDEYLKIMKTQRANGSFHRQKQNTAEYTAHILYKICTECEKADLFVWQLRKCAAYLLHTIGSGNSAVISESIIDALEAWHQKFGANDEISQKVAALTFMYRKN